MTASARKEKPVAATCIKTMADVANEPYMSLRRVGVLIYYYTNIETGAVSTFKNNDC
jgi:hypothetical protein